MPHADTEVSEGPGDALAAAAGLEFDRGLHPALAAVDQSPPVPDPDIPLADAAAALFADALGRTGIAARRVVAGKAREVEAVAALRSCAARVRWLAELFDVMPDAEAVGAHARDVVSIVDDLLQADTRVAVCASALERAASCGLSYLADRAKAARRRARRDLVEALGPRPARRWRDLAPTPSSPEPGVTLGGYAREHIARAARAVVSADLSSTPIAVRDVIERADVVLSVHEPNAATLRRSREALDRLAREVASCAAATDLARSIRDERRRLERAHRRPKMVARLRQLGDRAAKLAALRRDVLESAWAAHTERYGLASLAGERPERFAAIDIGTNTARVVVAERRADNRYGVVLERRLTPRLGRGLDATGEIRADVFAAGVSAVSELAEAAASCGASHIRAVATAAVRDARNGEAFLDQVEAASGVRPELLSAHDEGRLAFLSAAAAFGPLRETTAVIDLGGGSLELALGAAGQVQGVLSAPMGAVRVTERFGGGEACRTVAFESLVEHAAVEAGRLVGSAMGVRAVIGSGGSCTLAAKLALAARGERSGRADGAPRAHGVEVSLDDLDAAVTLLRETPVSDRQSLRGVSRDRAELALSGVVVVRAMVRALGATSMLVNGHGMRDGLLLEMVDWQPPSSLRLATTA